MIRITRTAEPTARDQWAITHYSQLNSLLAQHSSPGVVNLFAKPVQASDGATEWYSELNGRPVQLKDLPAADATRVEELLSRKLAAIASLRKTLPPGSLPENLHSLLEMASRQPERDSVWSIDGQPVITFWPGPEPVAAVPPPVVPPRRLWWLWLLLLLLLAALALFLLRGCIPQDPPVIPPVPVAPVPQPPVNTPPLDPATVIPPVVKPEPGPEPTPKPTSVPAEPIKPNKPVKQLCPSQRTPQQAPEVVLVVDGSGSMAISMDATPEELFFARNNVAIPALFREPQRISVARSSAKQLVDAIPKDMNISLVTALNCGRVESTSPFSFRQRGALKTQISQIQPDDKTPLADALARAGEMVDGVNRDAIILLVSDGEETCNGNPCDVARELKSRKPRLQVNVVDIMNTGAANCVAQSTGGKVYPANSTNEFKAAMNKAISEYIPKGCN